MDEVLERSFPITATEADMFGLCKPSALLRMLQVMATAHAECQGYHREYLLKTCNCFWMLVRTWYHLERPIRLFDTLKIRTWHRGARGAGIYRDYDLLVGDAVIGEAVGLWVITDMDTRKMVRPASIQRLAEAKIPPVVKKKSLRPFRLPEDAAPVYLKTVRYSDADVNRHMNNAVYADVFCDAFRPEELRGRFFSEVQLNFAEECAVGETMEVLRADTEDGCFLGGRGSDGSGRFAAQVHFSPDSAKHLDEQLPTA